MHSAILFILMPNGEPVSDAQQQQRLARDTENAKAKHPGIEVLGENCWLIPLSSGASALAAFVNAANTHRLDHRILFFEKAPDWVQPPKSAS